MLLANDRATRPRRVLLVALDNLGDLVFASALPRAIKAHDPAATVGLWCKSYTADIAPLIPDVDWVTAADPFWDDAPGRAKGGMRAFFRAMRRVRRARFDVALLASPQWRVAAAVAWTGIPMRIGQRRNYNRGLLTTVLPPADRAKPVVDDLGALLAPLGIAPAPLTTGLDARSLDGLRADYRGRLGSAPVAVVNPFVTLSPVGIPLAIWIDVARALSGRGYTVVWHGTAAQLAGLGKALPPEPQWRNAAELGDGTLRAAVALAATADIYLGCDSGPLHLSAALGIPVVGVFPLASKLPRFRPQGRGPAQIVQGPVTPAAILDAVDALPHRAPATRARVGFP